MGRAMKYTIGCTVGLLAGCGGDSPTEPVFPVIGEVREFADHREIDVEFASRGDVLRGTLYLPPTGTGFAAVAVNEGSSWEERAPWQTVAGPVTALNAAVFGYDRRGYGQSGGTPTTESGAEVFDVLSDDLVAAARAVAAVPLVRADRVGVIGMSQGGWVVPLAANKAPNDIAFTLVSVGGGVSSGQEALYDVLTGYDRCERTPTPMDDIIEELRRVGPSGYDPADAQRAMVQPTMWLYGGQDMSHPTILSVEQLSAMAEELGKPWTIVVLENANHSMIEGGAICQEAGEPADFATPWVTWFNGLYGGS